MSIWLIVVTAFSVILGVLVLVLAVFGGIEAVRRTLSVRRHETQMVEQSRLEAQLQRLTHDAVRQMLYEVRSPFDFSATLFGPPRSPRSHDSEVRGAIDGESWDA